MDVGSFDWPEGFDFSEAEAEPKAEEKTVVFATEDEAIDAAARLNSSGEWQAAIAAYRQVAERWPEHETYALNCIAEIERRLEM